MKLYRHPIMCASSTLDDTTPRDICSNIFEHNKQSICDIIKQRVNKRLTLKLGGYEYLEDFRARVNEFIIPGNLFNNCVQRTRTLYGLGKQITLDNIIYIRFPIYLLCEYMFATEYSPSEIANNHSEDFLEFAKDRDYQKIFTYVKVCHYADSITGLSEDGIISTIEIGFSDEYLSKCLMFLLDDPESPSCYSEITDRPTSDNNIFSRLNDEFINYCRSKYIDIGSTENTVDWAEIINELESEIDDNINSIYEQTSAGSYIDDIAQEVESDMGIRGEPSIQGGMGSIIFYNEDDDVIYEADYEEFCNDIIDLAMDSESEQSFRSKLSSMYKQFV